MQVPKQLTHWGIVMPYGIIGSGNGLAPIQHQSIIWTNADLSSNFLLETHFNEI